MEVEEAANAEEKRNQGERRSSAEAATAKLFAVEIASATKLVAVVPTQASDAEHEQGRSTAFMTEPLPRSSRG